MKGFTMQNQSITAISAGNEIIATINRTTGAITPQPPMLGSALKGVTVTIDANGRTTYTDSKGKPLSPAAQLAAQTEINIRGRYHDTIHPRVDLGIEMPSPRAWYEEDTTTLETATLFWELIKDELEASKVWERNWRVEPFLQVWGFEPDEAHEYTRGPHKINMSKEGRIRFMGALASYIDTTLNLEDGDLLEELLAWIQKDGPCPLYRKEERDGLVWREHPPHHVCP
jgi:hypothetical protein